MPDSFETEEDALLRRLREGASGDAAARQLRRRYDQLRLDYESLLERLGDLEARIAEPVGQAPAPIAAQTESLSSSILGPLLTLRDQYVETLGGLQALVSGIEGLAAGAFKGQRGPASQPAPESTTDVPRSYEVGARASSFPALLAFEEKLAAVPGVGRVSIHAIDSDRATFIVELD